MTVAAVAAAVLMAAFGTYYFLRKKNRKVPALACKAAATSLPGLLLIVHMLKETTDGGQLQMETSVFFTLAAILCYMAADVLLECRFVTGAVCFSGGHILMTAGFLFDGEINVIAENGKFNPAFWLWFVGVFVLFTAAAYVVFYKYFPALKMKHLLLPAKMYIAVLSIMAASAAASGINAGIPAGMIPVSGGVSFVISDLLLGINRLGKKRSRFRGAAVLILYYLSVYLFSMRLWI